MAGPRKMVDPLSKDYILGGMVGDTALLGHMNVPECLVRLEAGDKLHHQVQQVHEQFPEVFRRKGVVMGVRLIIQPVIILGSTSQPLGQSSLRRLSSPGEPPWVPTTAGATRAAGAPLGPRGLLFYRRNDALRLSNGQVNELSPGGTTRGQGMVRHKL